MERFQIHRCKVRVSLKPQSEDVEVSFALPVDDVNGAEMQRKTAEAIAISMVANDKKPYNALQGEVYEITATEIFEMDA